MELGKVELRAKCGRVPRAGGHRGQRMAGRLGTTPTPRLWGEVSAGNKGLGDFFLLKRK